MADLLVSLDVAKNHLNITDSVSSGEVLEKLEMASGVIMDYLKSRADDGWLDGTVSVPLPVRMATLILLTHYWENRGDNMSLDEQAWKAVERLLVRYRDPAYA